MAEQEKAQGPGQAQTGDQAAQRRAAWVAALEQERLGYERQGRSDRVEVVDAELRKFKGEDKPKATRGKSA